MPHDPGAPDRLTAALDRIRKRKQPLPAERERVRRTFLRVRQRRPG
jgi:hypothetical protein